MAVGRGGAVSGDSTPVAPPRKSRREKKGIKSLKARDAESLKARDAGVEDESRKANSIQPFVGEESFRVGGAQLNGSLSDVP